MITVLSGGTGTPKLLQGLKEVIDPKEGDEFDDSIHEAIAPISRTNESNIKNTIAFTQFKGYKLGNTVIRYAKVGVYV